MPWLHAMFSIGSEAAELTDAKKAKSRVPFDFRFQNNWCQPMRKSHCFYCVAGIELARGGLGTLTISFGGDCLASIPSYFYSTCLDFIGFLSFVFFFKHFVAKMSASSTFGGILLDSTWLNIEWWWQNVLIVYREVIIGGSQWLASNVRCGSAPSFAKLKG